MNSQQRQLLESAIQLLHRVIGLDDAITDFATIQRGKFRIEGDDRRELAFPTDAKTPHPNGQDVLKEINEMLLKMNVELNARLRKDGRYEIRPIVNGKRISVYGRTAEELECKYRAKLKGGKLQVQPKSCTLFSWLDEWIEVYKKPNVAPSTYRNIEQCVRNHIKPYLKDKPLNRYDMTELTQALNQITLPRMKKYTRGIMREAFACAVTVGKLKTSPAQNLLPVKHIPKKGKAIPLLELQDMIVASSSKLRHDVLRYFLFCLFAGTRRDEALNLKREHLDFKNRIIYIPGTKTEGSNRRIPMFPILEKLVMSSSTDSPYVFPIGKYHANTDFPIFRGKNTDVKLHWLRHTFGTVQICICGIPANTVALWLGHADAATTMRIYTHPEDLAPDIYYSGTYSEPEKHEILQERYNAIISIAERLLDLPQV